MFINKALIASSHKFQKSKKVFSYFFPKKFDLIKKAPPTEYHTCQSITLFPCPYLYKFNLPIDLSTEFTTFLQVYFIKKKKQKKIYLS